MSRMARPLRIEFAGALYHITARGNERRSIFFLCDEDRLRFLSTLNEVCERFNWHCHAYCQMTNHCHLLVETLDGNLAKGMRQLNGVYSQNINRTHSRAGRLFQGRYTDTLVEKEAYVLELTRYIVLNPVRACMVSQARDWEWSSYSATVGLTETPAFFDDGLVAFCLRNREEGSEIEIRGLCCGRGWPVPWQNLRVI